MGALLDRKDLIAILVDMIAPQVSNAEKLVVQIPALLATIRQTTIGRDHLKR